MFSSLRLRPLLPLPLESRRLLPVAANWAPGALPEGISGLPSFHGLSLSGVPCP